MSATTERLEWLDQQLTGLVAEEVVAGEIFRPRGAWGDRPMRARRILFRQLGRGPGLHELERHFGLLNLAAATPTRLLLFRLRGSRGAIAVEDQIAEWPVRGLEVASERRTVESTSAGGYADSPSTHTSRILVLRIEPRGEPALEIDLPDTKDGAVLVDALR
jgi:hypothetical protein